MAQVVDIIPELKEDECFRIVNRHKRVFSYPVHRHPVMELNFIEHGNGARRIVRDSTEVIGDYDLVILGDNLEHAWEQGACSSSDISEMTVHFDGNIFLMNYRGKRLFEPIVRMLEASARGISFGMQSVLSVYHLLNRMVEEKDPFEQLILFERIMNELARSPYRPLTAISGELPDYKFGRDEVAGAKDFIKMNYGRKLSLKEIADSLGISPTSLCRVFKSRTGITLYTYLIQTRIGKATRKLVDTTEKISDIAVSCGFSNISNFNRTFKASCNMTPVQYRETYQKNKQSV